MSYGRENKKIPVSWFLAAGRLARCGSDLPRRQRIPLFLIFAKKLRSGYSRPFPTIPSRRVML